jgi:hypothetical protein
MLRSDFVSSSLFVSSFCAHRALDGSNRQARGISGERLKSFRWCGEWSAAFPASPGLFPTSDACGFSILGFQFRHLEETFMDSQTAPASKTSLWAGRIISGLVVLFFLFGGVMGLMKSPDSVKGFVHLGYPAELAVPIAAVMLVCTVLYAIPQTAFLGAPADGVPGRRNCFPCAHRRGILLPDHFRRAGLGGAFPARKPAAHTHSAEELELLWRKSGAGQNRRHQEY